MMIEELSVIFAGTYQPAAGAFGLNRIAFLDPVGYIDVVYMLLSNMVTTEPVEIIPIPHLIFHFCLTGLPGAYPDTAAVPEYLSAYHIANGTVVQSLHGFAVVELVMALKPNDYIQFFSFCFFGGSQYTTDTWRSEEHTSELQSLMRIS